jgi:hypothetical protein
MATSAAYCGYLSFLVSAVAVWAGLVYYITLIGGNNAAKASIDTPTDTLSLVSFAITGLIAYVLFRVLAPECRLFDTHVKRLVLLAAFCFIVYVLIVVGVSLLFLDLETVRPDMARRFSAWCRP